MQEHDHLRKLHGKEILKMDAKAHPGEKHLLAVIAEANPDAGSAVQAARKMGLSWPTIMALLMQFGPQFVAILQAILAALATPPPRPGTHADEGKSDKKPRAAWREKYRR